MTQDIDVLMAAAIGALSVIFLASFVILVYICWRQKRNNKWERLEKRWVIYSISIDTDTFSIQILQQRKEEK